jgi:hypothetical protein
MKALMISLAKKAILWGLGFLYDYIDTDNDGRLEQEEIQEFILMIQDYLKQLSK